MDTNVYNQYTLFGFGLYDQSFSIVYLHNVNCELPCKILESVEFFIIIIFFHYFFSARTKITETQTVRKYLVSASTKFGFS